MPRSAGILLHRRGLLGPEVLLVHPGGPIWSRRDAGAWSIPKGEVTGSEEGADAAAREFAEELGSPLPPGERLALGSVRQKGGKVVTAWAVAGELDVTRIVSNTVTMTWPPRSGKTVTFPEVDRAGWFDLATAAVKIIPGQVPLLDRLAAALGVGVDPGDNATASARPTAGDGC